MAPWTEPIVPRTITANAGRRSVNPVSGLKRMVIAKIAPPIPEIPAERKALVICTRSTLIPLLAASSGLSATARILRPSRVLVRRRRSNATEPKITNGIAAL